MEKAREAGWFALGALLAAAMLLLTPLDHVTIRKAPLLTPAVTKMLDSGAVQSKPGAWSCTERNVTLGCGSAGCFQELNVTCSGSEKIVIFNGVASHALTYEAFPRNSSTWVYGGRDDGTGLISMTGYVLCCS
jgi:hypothetical protein